MSATSKIVWFEGAFVRPQHFQQFDRWVEAEINNRTTGLTPFAWGIRRLELDAADLALGRVTITVLEAILSDGTVVSIPNDSLPPPSRNIPAATVDTVVRLSIPVRRQELGDFAEPGADDSGRRYATLGRLTRDATAPMRDPIEIRIARLKASLLLDGEPDDDRVTLPLVRIANVTPVGEVNLSPSFVPPIMAISGSRAFQQMLKEVQVMLKSRGDAVASRLDPARMSADTAGIMDLMALGVINGREALLAHFAAVPALHPEIIYRTFVELVGSLCAFDTSKRRPPSFPGYRHDNIEGSFAPVVAALRDLLTIVYEEKAVSIPLQKRSVGVWVGTVADKTLFDHARFILVASAQVPTEVLRVQLPVQTKVSPVEVIRELVNLQLPGVPLKVLPVAPREIPFMRNAVYFELEQSGDLWRRLPQSAAFALHSSGDYPELDFELWAIRTE